MELVVVLALWLFAVTHVDTLVVLVAFCADEHYGLPEVFVGHYLGFGLGLLLAVLAATVATESIREWAFLLGLLPFGLGLWGLRGHSSDVVHAERGETVGVEAVQVVRDEHGTPASSVGRVAVVTTAGIGLSGENVAVFVPFFLTLSTVEFVVVLVAYVLAAIVPFALAFLLSRETLAIGIPSWLESWLVSITLVLLGGYVVVAGWIAV